MATASDDGNSLVRLPAELIADIFTHLTDVSDILSLCLVSKSLSALALSRLFAVTSVRVVLPSGLDGLGPFLERCPPSRSRLEAARRLDICPDVWDFVTNYCSHPENEDEFDPIHGNPWTAKEEKENQHAVSLLMPYLETVQDGSLQHFGWDMGICIPSQIIGPDGWLATRHKDIQSLRLINAGPQHYSSGFDVPKHIMDLASFKRIKSFAWMGLWSSIWDAVEVLNQNAQHLEHLELNLRRSDLWEAVDVFSQDEDEMNLLERFVQHSWRAPGLIRSIFNDHSLNWDRPYRFAALRELSLSHVPFDYEEEEFLGLLDWGRLSSLRLRFCLKSWYFLETLVRSGKPMNLKTFEFCSDTDNSNCVLNFLASFSGLENVYLHVEPFGRFTTYSYFHRLAISHGSTLRSLAFETRIWHNGMNWRHGWHDGFDALGLTSLDDMAKFRNQNPLQDVDNLECIGLTARPDILKLVLQPLVYKSATKVLHMRVPYTQDLSKTGAKKIPKITSPSSLWDYLIQYLQVRTPGSASSDLGNAQNGSGDDGAPKDPHEGILRVMRAGASSPKGKAAYCAAHPHPFFQFVNWVFGESGIPSLELLAYGDFGARGVPAEAGFFIRRREQPPPSAAKAPSWDFYPRIGSPGERSWRLDGLIRRHAKSLGAASIVDRSTYAVVIS